MNVTAFDSFNQEFDADQYTLMNFQLDFESQGVMREQGLEILRIHDQSNRYFNVTGVEPGKYIATATVK